MTPISKEIRTAITLSQDYIKTVKQSLSWYMQLLKEAIDEDEVYPELIVYQHVIETINNMKLQHEFTLPLHIIESHYLLIALSLYKEDFLRIEEKYEELKQVTKISMMLSDSIIATKKRDLIYQFEDLELEDRVKWLQQYYHLVG